MVAASPGRVSQRRTGGRGLRILRRRVAEDQQTRKAEDPAIRSFQSLRSGRAARKTAIPMAVAATRIIASNRVNRLAPPARSSMPESFRL
jgi:hypothetical protein